MRIVIHHRTQGQGVEGVHLLGMARGFEACGAEVLVLSPPGVVAGSISEAPRGRGGLRRFWRAAADHAPEFLFELLEIGYNASATTRIRRALRIPPANLLYERYAYFNVAGLLAARSAGVPVALEVNYTLDTPLHRRRNRLLRPLARATERFLMRHATLVATVSSPLRDQVLAAGVDPARVIVLPNAADPERFHPGVQGDRVRAEQGLSGKRVIGFSGAFLAWHGVDMILDALPEVRRRVPEVAVLLLGDGPLRSKLQARVQAEGLGDIVRFAGWTPHDRLPEYLAAFDLAVMPDSNEYGSPMKIYEYMAMGKPVVAPRLRPLEDGVEHGKVGLLVPRRDVAAFAAALAELLGDPERSAKMGRAAREHVLHHHTWARNAARVLERLQALGAAPSGVGPAAR
jgi:glycosyltransferase involved in cell wall biosynthesis